MNAATEEKGSAIRTLHVLEALCSFAATGAGNNDLAALVKTSPSNITRAMEVLIQKGWARKDAETGRFYPTPNLTRIAVAVMADFNRARQRLDDQFTSMTGAHPVTR